MLRTFQMYAGLTFLGYEYAEDSVEAIIKTRKKFGASGLWGIDEYTVSKILWREERV